MKHPKRLWLAGALVMAACGLAAPADATQLTPASTEVTFTSTNALLSVHNGGTIRAPSTITGTLPSTVSTWVAVPITLSYDPGCVANGALPCTIDVSEGCHTAASQPILHVMGIGGNSGMGTVTIPTGCTISATIPSIGCTFTIHGPQTVGDDTTGFGGGQFTCGATPTVHLNNSRVGDIIVDGPTSAACATAANHTATGTLTGTYTGNRPVTIDG